MKNRGITIEHAVFGVAFLSALIIRLISLGNNPLSDSEAALAMQAVRVSGGEAFAFGPQPLYVILTSIIFYLFNSTVFAARIIPALTGCLLIFVPYLLRNRIGKRASMILAFAFVFDPGFLALSRMADGRIMAVVFGLFAFVFILDKKPSLTGLCVSLALLSGQFIWQLIVTLLVVWGWVYLNKKFSVSNEKDESDDELQDSMEGDEKDRWNWRKAILWFLGTLVLTGTIFFWKPAGISSIFNGVVEYLKGWTSVSSASISRILLGLAFYELLPVFFGVWGGIYGWVKVDETDRILGRWLLVGLILLLAYPARQVADLIWILIPLWILAARQISRYPFIFDIRLYPAWGQAMLSVVLFAFASHHLLGLANSLSSQSGGYLLEWAAIGGAFLLIILIFTGVAWGWGANYAIRGLIWSVLVTLVVFNFSAGWNAGGMGRNPGAELWRMSPVIEDTDIFTNTLESFSQYTTGFKSEVDIRVVGVDSDSLHWLLRDFSNSQFVNYLDGTEAPSIVITQYQDQLSLASEYSGQDFIWQNTPEWDWLLPEDWIRWMMLRVVPASDQRMMIWVRSDLFPGDSADQTS